MRPSAAKAGARTNPSPHTAARGEQPLRPRPKNARRHWPAAGGSGAVIGATPRAGSISRGALREVVETQFKSRSGGSPGVWPVCFPFSTLPLRTAIRVRSGRTAFRAPFPLPPPCWRSSFSRRGRWPAHGPNFTAAARTPGWAFLHPGTQIHRRRAAAFLPPNASPAAKEKKRGVLADT